MAIDGENDYSTFGDEQLEEAARNIHRDDFPVNAARLDAERARRAALSPEERAEEARRRGQEPSAPPAPPPDRVMQPEFRGDAMEYFRIWIVNLALTIVTIGIYSAWAKVRKLKYFYGSTSLAGSSFGYHGDPIRILKGRLIAAALAGAYFVASQVSVYAVFAIAIVIALATPWLLVKSRLFTMRMTSWRGIRFDFEPDYAGAYRTILGWGVLAVVTFGLAVPAALCARYRFAVSNTRFGTAPFDCEARMGRFYKTAIVGAGLFIAIVVPWFMLLGGAMFAAGTVETPDSPAAQAISVLATLALYAVLLPIVGGYVQSRNLNEVMGRTTLGPHRLASALQARRLMLLYFTNVVGIVCSLGLLVPWAQVRLARYRVESTSVHVHGSIDEFVAGVAPARTSATGEEISDFFDVDFGL